MLVGLLAAAAAAGVHGIAAVLQAVAARSEAPTRGVDPGLLLRLVRHVPFLAAVALNLVGFVLHVVALRTLPLFLAQALTGASVAVTAVVGARVLRLRLGRAERGAVLAVCLGLALLTSAASDAGSTEAGAGVGRLLLATVGAVVLAGVLAARLPGPAGAALLGLAAGAGFAVVAVSARVLPALDPATLVTAPAAYALVTAGPLAFLLYATALQRAAVLTSTAPMVLGNTVAPAVIGVLLLGDQVRAGALPLAVVGLALATTGSVVLARYDPQTLAREAPAPVRARRPPAPGGGRSPDRSPAPGP